MLAYVQLIYNSLGRTASSLAGLKQRQSNPVERLSDRRVRQFRDPNHLIAGAIKKAETSGALHPDCCKRKGFLWDLTAASEFGARWGDVLPEPVLLNGPVVDTVIDLDAVVAKAK